MVKRTTREKLVKFFCTKKICTQIFSGTAEYQTHALHDKSKSAFAFPESFAAACALPVCSKSSILKNFHSVENLTASHGSALKISANFSSLSICCGSKYWFVCFVDLHSIAKTFEPFEARTSGE